VSRRSRLPDLLIWTVIALTLGVAVVVSIGQVFRPYVTLADAARSDRVVQVKGTVVEGTLLEAGGQVSFALRDMTGATAQVRFTGAMPPRLPEAEDVVVVGRSAEDGAFIARHILVRCPTKYRD
jgi:cytochrome c-type biogenesis protein CcmE